jgi:hypothetical protein
MAKGGIPELKQKKIARDKELNKSSKAAKTDMEKVKNFHYLSL